MEDKKKKILAKCASIGKTSKIFGRVDGKQPHLVHIGEYVVVGGESVILTHCPIRLYNRDPNIYKEKYRGQSFSEYIRAFPLDFNYRVIVGRGKVVPSCYDYIYRYESIQEEFDEIVKKIGLSGVKPLPRRKAHNRDDYRPWKEFVSKEDQKYIFSKIGDHLWLYKEYGYDL